MKAHLLILGQSLSGKSTLAKRLGKQILSTPHPRPQVIAFNPTNEAGYARPDSYGVRGADIEFTDRDLFLKYLLEQAAKNPQPRVLLIDEAHEFFGHNDKDTAWLGTRGRHYGFKIIAISQRLNTLSPTFRNQCSTIYSFYLARDDADTLTANYWTAIPNRDVFNLEAGEYVKIDCQARKLTKHKIF